MFHTKTHIAQNHVLICKVKLETGQEADREIKRREPFLAKGRSPTMVLSC
jgi:hypothetical protein